MVPSSQPSAISLQEKWMQARQVMGAREGGELTLVLGELEGEGHAMYEEAVVMVAMAVKLEVAVVEGGLVLEEALLELEGVEAGEVAEG